MERVNEEGDDLFNTVCGDLGLGESTRSRNYLNFEDLKLNSKHTQLSVSDSCLHVESKSISCWSKHQCDTTSKDSLKSNCCQHSGQIVNSDAADDGNLEGNLETFPTYADVPYGTSLRQQKKLYEQQIDSLRRQFAGGVSGDGEDSKKSNLFKMTAEEIGTKLVVAKQEMEELKIELDACRKRLDAKYQAVEILRQQAELADTELKNSERRASETSKRLEQELSKLQFELEWRESSFMDSQQTWAERFDRVCQENAILMSKLEARNEELRRANAHKSAIGRERDELLALLDVTERLKYEQGKSKVAAEDYGSFTSTELAVLGACKCRVSSPEPCGCAHAAANLRKEVAKLREELECCQQRREESNLTVDAYRSAFEEQLSRSRNMSIRLSQIATMSSRSTKAKAAIKWLIQVLNDDDYVPSQTAESGTEAEKGNFSNMSLQELVTLLTDMVHEKNEALAHQKLASQVLANKLERFEKRERNQSDLMKTETNPRHKPEKKQKQQSKMTPTVSAAPRSEGESADRSLDISSEEKKNGLEEFDAYVDDDVFAVAANLNNVMGVDECKKSNGCEVPEQVEEESEHSGRTEKNEFENKKIIIPKDNTGQGTNPFEMDDETNDETLDEAQEGNSFSNNKEECEVNGERRERK